ITLLGRAGDSGGGGVNKSAQQGLVADNPDVMLDTRAIRNAVEQPGDVGRAADGFEFTVSAEFLCQRDQVDGTRGVRKIHHARVNTAVGIEEKVFGLQVLGSLIVGKVVEKNRAEDRALSFYVCRKCLRGNVIS